MIPNVVEIGSPDLYLSKSRGFLSIRDGKGGVNKLPLDSIGVLVITSHQATLSTALMNALSERGIIAVLCNQKHRPVSYLYPLEPHSGLTGRLYDQIAAGKPLKKRLWQCVVRAKISNQAWLLETHGRVEAKNLYRLSSEVISGDRENREAQAARVYWQALFGKEFRRLPRGEGINQFLDYGYGILRSAVLRAIAGSGLTPALGLAHHNRRNPFCLADDAMEPYRPLVDAQVFQIHSSDRVKSLSTPVKGYLAKILTLPVKTVKGHSPLARALAEMTQSLARCYANQKNELLIPSIPGNINEDIARLWDETDIS